MPSRMQGLCQPPASEERPDPIPLASRVLYTALPTQTTTCPQSGHFVRYGLSSSHRVHLHAQLPLAEPARPFLTTVDVRTRRNSTWIRGYGTPGPGHAAHAGTPAHYAPGAGERGPLARDPGRRPHPEHATGRPQSRTPQADLQGTRCQMSGQPVPDEMSGRPPLLEPRATRTRGGRGKTCGPGLLCGRVHAWVDTVAGLVHTAPEQHGSFPRTRSGPQREVIHDHTDADKDGCDIL